MKLQEVFDQLATGELSQLAIGADGAIAEANWPKALAHVNLGLTDLYKRFYLKEGRLTLQMVDGQLVYPLHSDYSVLSQKRPTETKFILDSTADRFSDDLVKVERVTTADGFELGLNDAADRYSVSTPTMTRLRVPEDVVGQSADLPDALKTETLEVIYRATHPKVRIPIGYFDPNRVELELPESHLQALLLFVASRVHRPVGMGAEGQGANDFWMLYEAECQRLDNGGIEIDRDAQNSRLQRGGWV